MRAMLRVSESDLSTSEKLVTLQAASSPKGSSSHVNSNLEYTHISLLSKSLPKGTLMKPMSSSMHIRSLDQHFSGIKLQLLVPLALACSHHTFTSFTSQRLRGGRARYTRQLVKLIKDLLHLRSPLPSLSIALLHRMKEPIQLTYESSSTLQVPSNDV